MPGGRTPGHYHCLALLWVEALLQTHSTRHTLYLLHLRFLAVTAANEFRGAVRNPSPVDATADVNLLGPPRRS